jgi:hypothetical protein
MAPEWTLGRSALRVQVIGDLKAVIRVAHLVVSDAAREFLPNGAPRGALKTKRPCETGWKAKGEIECCKDAAIARDELRKL